MTDGLGGWARSGLAWLSGHPDGPPLCGPASLIEATARWVSELAEVAGSIGLAPVIDHDEALAQLVQRAAHGGLSRNGSTSPGGSCRMLPTANGTLAVNLPRRDDAEMVPAWLGIDGHDTHLDWDAIAQRIRRCDTTELVETAQLLGLAVAALPEPGAPADEQLTARDTITCGRVPLVERVDAPAGARRMLDGALVVDLSSLWAGPLCAQLLGRFGARVVKVESEQRPDGARRGPQGFYDMLHSGHESICLPLHTSDGRAALRRLLARADVIIEASRPRALEQLGIHAHEVLGERAGVTWVSITAYGRSGPWSNRVGFGDDTAAAAGLVLDDGDGAVFCADAIADPLTGLAAAATAARAHVDGGGALVDAALREVASTAVSDQPQHAVPSPVPAHRPVPVIGSRRAPGLGADTARIRDELRLDGR